MRTTILLCAALFLAGCGGERQGAGGSPAKGNTDEPIIISDGTGGPMTGGTEATLLTPTNVHHDKKFHQKSAADPYYVKDIDFQAAWLELRQTPRTLVQLLYQKSCSVTLSSPTQTLVLESGDAADKPHKDEVTLIPTGIQSPNAGSSPTDVPFSSFVFNKVVLELDGVQTTILNGPFPPTSAPTVCIHYCKGGNCDINLLKVCQ